MTYAVSEACMGDTPPDRDEASAAPDGPRNPWVSWLTWLLLTPVLYVLSVGPAHLLWKKGIWKAELEAIYYPLRYLPDHILQLIDAYMKCWLAP